MYFNVFECIYRHCNWISPSLFHCNVFAIFTHLHFFFHSTMTPFPTCYTTTFLFSIPVVPFQPLYNLSLLFTSIHHPMFHIPHSMSSLVARSPSDTFTIQEHINEVLLVGWTKRNIISNDTMMHHPSIHMPSYLIFKKLCVVCKIPAPRTYCYRYSFKFMCWKRGVLSKNSWSSLKALVQYTSCRL
jgi:hypothetical protein